MSKVAVVALGGNAFTLEGQSGTYEEQSANATAMAACLVELLDEGWNLAIVHGNGPQVGNIAIQQEDAVGHVPAQPLFSLVAMTQGELGSLISLAVQAASAMTPGSRLSPSASASRAACSVAVGSCPTRASTVGQSSRNCRNTMPTTVTTRS